MDEYDRLARRGCAALCLRFDVAPEWPPEPSLWVEGDRDLEHLAGGYDDDLPEGWEDCVDSFLDTAEAAWCLSSLGHRLGPARLARAHGEPDDRSDECPEGGV